MEHLRDVYPERCTNPNTNTMDTKQGGKEGSATRRSPRCAEAVVWSVVDSIVIIAPIINKAPPKMDRGAIIFDTVAFT